MALFRRVPATFLLKDLVFELPARSSVRRVDSDRYRRLSDAAFSVTAFVTERTAVRHALFALYTGGVALYTTQSRYARPHTTITLIPMTRNSESC